MEKAKTLAQLMALPKVENRFWIEPEILEHGGTMMVYGFPETYKTMLVSLDMAFCLATGTKWLGYETKKCRVLVVQVEQTESAFAARLSDWVKAHGLQPKDVNDNLDINSQILLSEDEFKKKVEAQAQAQQAAMAMQAGQAGAQIQKDQSQANKNNKDAERE